MTTDVAVIEQRPALTVFGTDDPAAIMRRVTDIATPLADFIRQKHMTRVLESAAGREKRMRERPNEPPREYVQIEGWSFMGAMLGIAPVAREVRELRGPEGDVYGFEARVELVNRAGEVVGGGIGECSWAESQWQNRDPYALKSMAQTRATGKAFRLALGFVMSAAGFEATPVEEMTPERDGEQTVMPPQPRTPPRRAAATQPKAEWADELKSAMEQAECSFEDIERFLQARPTNANIEGWLREHAPSGVSDLVALAMPVSAEPF